MKFSNVIGQERIKQLLRHTVDQKRISHAQLFVGEQGTGNLPLAIAYAQYINCTNKQDGDSCGECPSCIKYEKLIHPDLHFIYPTATTKTFDKPTSKDFIKSWRELVLETTSYFSLTDWYGKIGIERKQAIINARDCNEIIGHMNYHSYEANFKVVIIWMVEKLFHAAAPKLLKVFEEPPENTLFLLVAEKQEQILPTILSRTQIVKIPPIGAEELEEALMENIEDVRAVKDAVKVSGGNYLLALQALQTKESEQKYFKWFVDWMRLCYAGKSTPLIEFVSQIAYESRETHKAFIIYTLRMVRETFLQNVGQPALSRMYGFEDDFVKKFHPFINTKNLSLINEELNKTLMHVERNANANPLFLDLSFKMAAFLKM